MIDTKRLATDAAYWDEVAPEGATHYDPSCDHPECWARKASSGWDHACEEITWHTWWPVDTSHFIPRPTKPTLSINPLIKRAAELSHEKYGEAYRELAKDDGLERVDGLPPVGVECEVQTRVVNSTDWQHVRIVFYSHGKVWLQRVGQFPCVDDWVADTETLIFRPIRTKEQREREDWINRASKAAGFPECAATRKVCSDIYDGLIKIKGL